MKSTTTHSLIVCLILTVGHLSPVHAVTDAELEALEQQIEQLETDEEKQADAAEKKKADAEAKRKAEEARLIELERQRLKEDKRIADEKRKSDELTILETERKHKAENERLRVESEKREKHDNHIKKAATYMEEEKYNQAIGEYEQLLNSSPDDIRANEGIRNAQKLLNSCKEIVGNWQLSHGPSWVVYNDNTVDGAWLIFSTKGIWKCLSAREREFVVSWPDHGWVDYFKLSEDANTLQPIRDTIAKNISGSRIEDIKKKSTTTTPTPSL